MYIGERVESLEVLLVDWFQASSPAATSMARL